MTMLPAHNRNLSKQDQQQQQYKCGTGEEGGYGGYNNRHRYSSVMSEVEVEVEGYKNYWRESWLGSEWDMIEGKQMGDQDESRTTNSLSVSLNEGGGSTSKQDRDEGWLQLGIAGCDTQRPTSPSKHHEEEGQEELGGSTPPSHRLVELELLPPPPPQQHHPPPPHLQGSGRPLLTYPPPPSNLVFQPPTFAHHHHQQYSTWAFPPPMPMAMGMPSSSSSCASLRTTALPSYFASPFHFPAAFDDAGAGPSSSDVRVVHPPRRPHSGIWFMLQASPNQYVSFPFNQSMPPYFKHFLHFFLPFPLPTFPPFLYFCIST